MTGHGVLDFKVIHRRLSPKFYQFKHRFFWFKIDLDQVSKWSVPFVSYNKFNLYSFWDSDHIKLGGGSARENYIAFAKIHGMTKEITNVSIYTQMRFLGYVFNPVSFIFLTDEQGKQHAIIEIGNTFNELKPYFVSHDDFNGSGFSFKTKKMFYISPFIEHDNTMTFKLKMQANVVNISIIDENESTKVLEVFLTGKEKKLTSWELTKQTLRSPFVTLQFISLIHYHALILWFKGIKYFKKDEHLDLQQGKYTWKP